jgi:hypothetical protein
MAHAYWNDWYFGWGWFLWFGGELSHEDYARMKSEIAKE